MMMAVVLVVIVVLVKATVDLMIIGGEFCHRATSYWWLSFACLC